MLNRYWIAGWLILASVVSGRSNVYAAAEAVPESKVRKFTFHYRFQVKNLRPTDGQSDKLVRVWVPSPPDSDCQRVVRLPAAVPGTVSEHLERHNGNGIRYFETRIPPSGEFIADFPYDVVRQEVLRKPDRTKGRQSVILDEMQRALYLRSYKLVPTTGRPLQLLDGLKLKGDKAGLARQLYDLVDDHVAYKKEGVGWGRGDSNWVCDSRYGNCTDFHSLFMSLARSQGLPARFEIGCSIPTDRTEGAIAGYHCWAWFYLDTHGWIPVDISEADKHPDLKDYYFGNLTADRMTFSIGRDLELEPKAKHSPLNYFIYPHVEIGDMKLPSENVEMKWSFEETR